jgi:hypothetical protein
LINKNARIRSEKLGLIEHETAVVDFLRVASELGHVAIITMAEKKWVNRCIAVLMPAVGDVLEELQIEIVSARESLSKWRLRSAFSDERDPSHFLKTKAMEKTIKRFYKRDASGGTRKGSQRSWKNVVSIGDSSAERLALQDLVLRQKECRCKTLLLLESPSVDQMVQQLHTMTELVPAMVRHDGDIDLDMSMNDYSRPKIRNHN